MINIISRSILNRKTRGPKKVVNNLIKGLNAIDYPCVLNRSLDSTNRLWIQDDISALRRISNLPERVRVMVGPNLFVNPENIPQDINLKDALYLQPSETVKSIWEKKGYSGKIAVWPVGVDTKKFTPSNENKEYALIYFKNRDKDELEILEKILKEKSIFYKLITYGNYIENEYIEILKKTKYIIWLGCPESQGLALEEAMSMNIPILVLDSKKTYMEETLTSAPYFSSDCGIKIRGFKKLDESLEIIERDWQKFSPRDYILQNLSLERQAHEFINLYEDHFQLTVDEGKREKLQNDGVWRNDKMTIVKKIIRRIKYHLFHIPKERVWRAYVLFKTKDKPVRIIQK